LTQAKQNLMEPRLIVTVITAVLYSAPSRQSTHERSQPNLGQTVWS